MLGDKPGVFPWGGCWGRVLGDKPGVFPWGGCGIAPLPGLGEFFPGFCPEPWGALGGALGGTLGDEPGDEPWNKPAITPRFPLAGVAPDARLPDELAPDEPAPGAT